MEMMPVGQFFFLRIAMASAFLAVLCVLVWRLWIGGNAIQQLLKLGQEDKLARELAVQELKEVANDLQHRTEKIAEDLRQRNSLDKEIVHKQLAEIDKKVETNTALTSETLQHIRETNGKHKQETR